MITPCGVITYLSLCFCIWCTQVLLFSQHLAIGAKLIMFRKATCHVSAPHQQIPTVMIWPWVAITGTASTSCDHIVMQQHSQRVAMQFAVPHCRNVQHTAVLLWHACIMQPLLVEPHSSFEHAGLGKYVLGVLLMMTRGLCTAACSRSLLVTCSED